MCVAASSPPSSAACGKKRERAGGVGRGLVHLEDDAEAGQRRVRRRMEQHVGDHAQAVAAILDPHTDLAGCVAGQIEDRQAGQDVARAVDTLKPRIEIDQRPHRGKARLRDLWRPRLDRSIGEGGDVAPVHIDLGIGKVVATARHHAADMVDMAVGQDHRIDVVGCNAKPCQGAGQPARGRADRAGGSAVDQHQPFAIVDEPGRKAAAHTVHPRGMNGACCRAGLIGCHPGEGLERKVDVAIRDDCQFEPPNPVAGGDGQARQRACRPGL